MSEFEKELGWDDVIEKESDFTLLPAGDYDFTIKASSVRDMRAAKNCRLATRL